jgi:type IV secretory pathway component VirB8
MSTHVMHPVSDQHIDNAAHAPNSARAHYLEQAGDLTVTNNFLKVLSLVLGFAVLASIAATVAVAKHYANMKPLVIRIDGVGKAEAVKYDEATYQPQEKEMRYFVSQWAQYYYGRNRFTVKEDFPKSFYFMDAALARNLMITHQQRKDVEGFINNPSTPNTYIEINQVVLDHLNQPPFAATVSFTAKQVAPYSDEVVGVTHYTANVQFMFRPDVPNSMVTVNPLGFTILAFHDAEAFN